MISDKQKQLCMTFTSGELREVEPPAWFVEHLERGEQDWGSSLSKSGASLMDSFGEGETFETYRSPNGYFVDYTDTFESAAWIFINSAADYLTFRATMLAPLVMLALEADRAAAAELASDNRPSRTPGA